MSEVRPVPASASVQARLKRQRRRDTRPELELRRALFARGHRYRVNYPVPTKPRRSIDVAFTRIKVAIFVDGCFWHGCPAHFVPPKNNSGWWAEKIAKNKARDTETRKALTALGWHVVSLWEHEDIDRSSKLVESAIEIAQASELPVRTARW